MSKKIVGVGEILWDLLPTGKKLGGAPANFAYHAHELGAQAHVISRVGNDPLGREILAQLQDLGLPADGVSVDQDHPTGTVTVELAADGQPCFTIHEGVAWDHLVADAGASETVAAADVVCFGSLAQRCASSHTAIRTILASSPAHALRVFDVNLRQHFYSTEVIEGSLRLANVLKLNDTELPVLARLLGIPGNTDKQQLTELANRFGLRAVIYTCGSRGCMLFDGRTWTEHTGMAVQVKDTVGAGDALTAAATLGMLLGWDLKTIGDRANQIAAYVCSCEGATPKLPKDLCEPYLCGQ